MCAAQNHGVDVGVHCHERIDVLAHEEVGTVAVGFAVFHKRHPHGAAVAVGVHTAAIHLLNLDVVTLTLHRARSAENAYVAIAGEFAHLFHCGANHAEHAALRVDFR